MAETQIPDETTAVWSKGVGHEAKPKGRPVVPQDCVVVYDLEGGPTGSVLTRDQIQSVFYDGELDEQKNAGYLAADAYSEYVSTLGKSDKKSLKLRKDADGRFRKIAKFGLDEVVKFENKVRSYHGIELRPEE